jgi:hypothetical protein
MNPNNTLSCFYTRLNDLQMKLSAKKRDNDRITWLYTYLHICLQDLLYDYKHIDFDYRYIRDKLLEMAYQMNPDIHNGDLNDGFYNIRRELHKIA